MSHGGVDYSFDAIGTRPVIEMILKVTRPGGAGADNLGGTAVLIGVPGNEMSLDPRHFLSSQSRFITSFGASSQDRDFKNEPALVLGGEAPARQAGNRPVWTRLNQ